LKEGEKKKNDGEYLFPNKQVTAGRSREVVSQWGPLHLKRLYTQVDSLLLGCKVSIVFLIVRTRYDSKLWLSYVLFPNACYFQCSDCRVLVVFCIRSIFFDNFLYSIRILIFESILTVESVMVNILNLAMISEFYKSRVMYSRK